VERQNLTFRKEQNPSGKTEFNFPERTESKWKNSTFRKEQNPSGKTELNFPERTESKWKDRIQLSGMNIIPPFKNVTGKKMFTRTIQYIHSP
jgi:hypothetical protein